MKSLHRTVIEQYAPATVRARTVVLGTAAIVDCSIVVRAVIKEHTNPRPVRRFIIFLACAGVDTI